MQKLYVTLSESSKTKTVILFRFVLMLFILFSGCSDDKIKQKHVVVIGVPSDVSSINPLYAFNIQEGHLLDLLFLKPASESWNDSLGEIEFSPMLAESWQINKDSSFITLNLRDNIFWSDGKPITVDDFIFSFDAYSDPKVNSRLYGLFENFYTSDDLHIDITKTFRKNSNKSITIFIKDINAFSFIDINHSILPKHVYDGLIKEDFQTAEINFNPVTSGPFKLFKWDRDQKIHLVADSSCYLYNEKNVQEVIFKIIPDEFSMITQLKKGEIDIIEDVSAEKVKELEESKNISIGSIKGRDYDYVGWNHIDPKSFSKKQKSPNQFFSSADVRKALSLAINRNEIFNSIIKKYGQIYTLPISPIFKKYYQDSFTKTNYDPSLAKKILENAGWKDTNGDGIVDKNGIDFSFKIYSNTGNSNREYSGTIIKNNLREIGIDAQLIFVDKNELIDGLLNRKYDSWISGWSIEIPLSLESYWSSNPQKSMLNFVNYSNEELEKIFEGLKSLNIDDEKTSLYKRAAEIFAEDEPVTVLFWTDNIVAYNKRVKNISFSPLGLFTYAWQWQIEK